jgi:hypothetical protein
MISQSTAQPQAENTASFFKGGGWVTTDGLKVTTFEEQSSDPVTSPKPAQI